MLRYLTPAVVVLAFSAKSLAEQKGCPRGQNCELTTTEKIELSARGASLVASGRFRVESGIPVLERLSEDRAFILVSFEVDRVFKGTLSAKVLKLKLPIYTPKPGQAQEGHCTTCPAKDSKSAKKEVPGAAFSQREQDLEQGRLSKAEYQSKLASLRDQILSAPEYAYRNRLLVPIERGGLDAQYRLAIAAVHPGDRYILMLFRELVADGYTPVFSHELDIYPPSKAAVVRRVARKRAKP